METQPDYTDLLKWFKEYTLPEYTDLLKWFKEYLTVNKWSITILDFEWPTLVYLAYKPGSPVAIVFPTSIQTQLEADMLDNAISLASMFDSDEIVSGEPNEKLQN